MQYVFSSVEHERAGLSEILELCFLKENAALTLTNTAKNQPYYIGQFIMNLNTELPCIALAVVTKHTAHLLQATGSPGHSRNSATL